MNNTNVRVFIKLAEVLNFTKAAEQLYMTQSGISRQIAAMEKELGLTLFERDNKNVLLTSSGEILYKGLRDLSWKYEKLVEAALTIEQGLRGTIKMGAVAGQQISSMLPVLSAFEKKYPDVIIDFKATSLKDLRQLLSEGYIDFGFGVRETFEGSEEYDYKVIAKIKRCLAITKNHPFFNEDETKYTMIDFKDDVFITYAQTVNMQEILKDLCEKLEFTPKQIVAPDFATTMLLLEAGRGVVPLDKSSSYSTNPAYKFVPVPEFGYCEHVIAWNTNNTNECVEVFTDFLNEFVANTKIAVVE